MIDLLPEIAKPENPTASVRQTIANVVLSVLPTRIKKNASKPNPPQLKIFRTFVVVNWPDVRRKSAKCPPNGTTNVIQRCGSAPNRPDLIIG
ncbi:hypothetical protein QR98_0062850 [Sarcoptes scabiei]|uniref:Uncharacterized protein n=1 Tax=Sarcoptes scabiei TaxID=52283 RepID=A0A132AA38_SARSC|nr:hypothetical protein QR98_0062850 [Sarcoptes scabiei]